MTAHMEPLKVRITNIDWSLVRSGSLDNTRFSRCPVIRVFGVSSAGLKACVHIHQVYPYFYIPYDGPMAPEDGKFNSVVPTTLVCLTFIL